MESSDLNSASATAQLFTERERSARLVLVSCLLRLVSLGLLAEEHLFCSARTSRCIPQTLLLHTLDLWLHTSNLSLHTSDLTSAYNRI